MTRRIETFNFGLLFGTETSPTYSQQETPIESFHVDTDTACSTPVEPDTLRYVLTFTLKPFRIVNFLSLILTVKMCPAGFNFGLTIYF